MSALPPIADIRRCRWDNNLNRDTSKDDERKRALRQWIFALVDGHPVDFDALRDKLETSIPKAWFSPPARSLPAHPHKSAHRLHASVVVPTYVDIPSDSGLTPQHNSLAHNIKLYAERLPMFRAH
jgi:hypothetical protein